MKIAEAAVVNRKLSKNDIALDDDTVGRKLSATAADISSSS